MKLYSSHSGFLYNELRNTSRKATKETRTQNEGPIDINSNDEPTDSNQAISSAVDDELLNFFKHCTVEQNEDELQL